MAAPESRLEAPLRIDIGCGAVVKPGFIGIDREPADGVQHVVDVECDPLPLPDQSVSEIWHENAPPPSKPIRTYCHTRTGQAMPIESTSPMRDGRLAGVARRIFRSVTGRGQRLAS